MIRPNDLLGTNQRLVDEVFICCFDQPFLAAKTLDAVTALILVRRVLWHVLMFYATGKVRLVLFCLRGWSSSCAGIVNLQCVSFLIKC